MFYINNNFPEQDMPLDFFEIDFYIVAPDVSMNLSAMSVCTKHGLWQSEDKPVKVI